MQNPSKKAFTLIEILAVVAVFAILVLLAVPRFVGYAKQAGTTRLFHDAKVLENASQAYYLDHGDWPRLSDTPYTATEIEAFAVKIYDYTGKVITLDPAGQYYDLDMTKLAPYVTLLSDPKNFVLQNPVGSVYILDPDTNTLTSSAAAPGAPVAVITMTPYQNITTTTTITWDASGSYDPGGGTIAATEWTGQQATYSTAGTYTVSLRVQNDAGNWSDPATVTFSVANAQSVRRVVPGGGFSAALLYDGTVKTWGQNNYGQLGLGGLGGAYANTNQSYPVAIPGLAGVQQIAAGADHTLVLLEDGTLKSWGSNGYGQLGYEVSVDYPYGAQLTPRTIPGIANVKTIAAGQWFSVAILNDGKVMTWGNNERGQLGNGTTGLRQPTPMTVTGLSNVVQASAGAYHTVARLADGTLKAWGDGSVGALGTGTTTSSLSPVAVATLTNVAHVTAGRSYNVALLSDGTVAVWGNNTAGELGLGDTSYRYSPVTNPNLVQVQQIEAGNLETIALLADGTVRTWGHNAYGQLGIGNTTTQTLPVAISGLANVSRVAADAGHMHIMLVDGTSYAWGNNQTGQLGIGSTINQNTPVVVTSLN